MGAAGDAAASGASNHLESVCLLFETYNELVRTDADVVSWVQEHFDAQAEYRPIEDRDWFRDPDAITRSLIHWVETWSVGTHRIEPREVLDLGDERFLVTAHNSGVGRRSGVPIEVLTYMGMIWRGGKLVWFDEYLDREEALTALGEPTSTPDALEPAAGLALPDRFWKLSEAAFAALVRGRSDRQLERLFGSEPALRAIFKRTEQLFEPAKADGFTGEIQYELLGSKGVKKWVVQIDGGRAITRAGEAQTPAATLRMGLAVFVRVAARELHPAKAYRKGWLEVSGSFEVAARVNVMFGLSKVRLRA